jgi:methyl-accepting chemotaxis protein-1 (serine sensor receptor)
MGANIDSFHKNPAHQRGMLKNLSTTYRTKIVVGGRTFSLIANPIFNEAKERIGTSVEWLNMTEQLAARDREVALATENTRIKIALDNVATNVMIADNDRNITYLNKSITAMLINAESDIRKELPSFNSAKLLGTNIDGFHKNPAHQRTMLATFTNTHRVQIVVGGRTFALVANPVISESGERLGSVVEWNDRTLEVTTEREVSDVAKGVMMGDFRRRIEMSNKVGFFKLIGEAINQISDVIENNLNDVMRVIEALSVGDLRQKI